MPGAALASSRKYRRHSWISCSLGPAPFFMPIFARGAGPLPKRVFVELEIPGRQL